MHKDTSRDLSLISSNQLRAAQIPSSKLPQNVFNPFSFFVLSLVDEGSVERDLRARSRTQRKQLPPRKVVNGIGLQAQESADGLMASAQALWLEAFFICRAVL